MTHTKISLLAAYNSVYRYDICRSGSILDSTISDHNNILHLKRNNLIRKDHPDNIKEKVSVYTSRRV